MLMEIWKFGRLFIRFVDCWGLLAVKYGNEYFICNMQSKKIFKLKNNDNFKFLKNKEELQGYIKVLIEY